MEARRETELSCRLLTRKLSRSFLNGTEEGSFRNSSEFSSFLGSMLGLEEDRLDAWEVGSHHSSLPNLPLIPGPRHSSAGQPRPADPWAAAGGCQVPPATSSLVLERGPSRGDTGLTTGPSTALATHSMVRGQAGGQRSVRRTSSTSRNEMAGNEKCPIVRPAIRLPKALTEKMPSAPNSPVSQRKDHVVSKLACDNTATVTKKTPKTVASMVRR